MMGRLPTGRSHARPSFFKFMINDFKEKLRLPPAFVKKSSGNVPQNIILRGPNKRCYVVSVKHDDKDFFLCDEWITFTHDHDLEFGDLLVFSYNVKSELTVIIFSGNACEKELALVEETVDHETANISKLHDQVLDKSPEKCRHKKVAEAGKPTSCAVRLNTVREESHSFTAIVGPSNKHHMTVPRWLVKEKGLLEKSNATLLDPRGRSCNVKIVHRPHGTTQLRRGWLEYCMENDINTGDTCNFEFVEGSNTTIRVEVSKRAPVAEQACKTKKMSVQTTAKNVSRSGPVRKKAEKRNQCGRLGVAQERERERVVAESGFTSDNPFCSLTLRSTYVQNKTCLVIPRSFAKAYLKDATEDVTLQGLNGGKWHARFSVGAHSTLTTGWKEFVVGNQLQENDVCILELVQRKPTELKVTIIRP